MYIFTPNTLIESSKVNANFAEVTAFTGAWTTWTPTYYNLTVGNGTTIAKYVKIGKTVICFIQFTLGSSSAVTGSVSFSLPVTGKNAWGGDGTLYAERYQQQGYRMTLSIATDKAYLYCLSIVGSVVGNGNVSSNTPFIWQTNDYFAGYFMYEAA